MEKCLICGGTHNEKIGDKIHLLFLSQVSSFFVKVMNGLDFGADPSPLCKECLFDYIRFVDQKSGLIAAEFLCWCAEKRARSRKTKEGLMRARILGKKLGRRRKIDHQMILDLRKRGLSYRQIQKEMSIKSTGSIGRVINTEKLISKSAISKIIAKENVFMVATK